MTYALKFIACAVICLAKVGQTLADPRIDHIEYLLQRPLWSALKSYFPDEQICDTVGRSVSVRELFNPSSSNFGYIVDKRNVNNKVRQYYNLLRAIFSEVVMHHLFYFSRLIHRQDDLLWDVKYHIVELIRRHCDKIYSMMDGALSCVDSLYVGDRTRLVDGIRLGGGAPRLDRQWQWDLQYLKSVDCNTHDLFRWLREILRKLRTPHFVQFFWDTVQHPYIESRYAWNGHFDALVEMDGTDEERIEYSKLYLDFSHRLVLEKFNDFGFQYDEQTKETRILMAFT